MAKKNMTVNMPGVNVNDALAAAAAGEQQEAKEVKQEVKKKAPVKPKAKVNVKQEEKSTAADLLTARAQKEIKNVAVNLRVKPSVKERFDLLCTKLNYSQSDLFETLVSLAEETIKEQGKK